MVFANRTYNIVYKSNKSTSFVHSAKQEIKRVVNAKSARLNGPLTRPAAEKFTHSQQPRRMTHSLWTAFYYAK